MAFPAPHPPAERARRRGPPLAGWAAGTLLATLAALPAPARQHPGEAPGESPAAAAYAALRAGEEKRAARLLEAALDTASAPVRRRQIALDLGHVLTTLDRPSEAAEAFGQAAAIVPEARSFAALGYAHLDAGAEEAARNAFQQALALRPRDRQLHTQLAYLYKARGRRVRAARHFRTALRIGAEADALSPSQRARLLREIRGLELRFWSSLTLFPSEDSRPATRAAAAAGARSERAPDAAFDSARRPARKFGADSAGGETAGGGTESAAAQGYAALRAGETQRAERLLARALDGTTAPARRRQIALDLGHLRTALDRPNAAARAFEQAAAIEPGGQSLRALGYARLAAGQREAAIDAFQRALDFPGPDPQIHRQLGYLYKSRARRAKAARHFRKALRAGAAAGRMSALERTRLRREVRGLENRVWGGLTLFWRRDGETAGRRELGERSLRQSQGLAEVNFRFGAPDLGRGRWLAGFARLLWGINGADPLVEGDTLQAGLGLKLKPFAARTLTLAAERLVAVGDAARDDWLLRAAWSTGSGFRQPPPGAGSWLAWNSYVDTALIAPGDPDLQLNAENRLGWGVTLGPVSLIPHLLVSGFLQDDAVGTDSLLEAGPALALRLPINGTPERAADLALEMRLSYRHKLAGSAANPDGAALTLSLRY